MRESDLFYTVYTMYMYLSVVLGNSRKYPYLYHGRLFGISKAWRGSLNWNSEGMGGFSDVGFPEGTDKSVFLKNANFVDFTGS